MTRKRHCTHRKNAMESLSSSRHPQLSTTSKPSLSLIHRLYVKDTNKPCRIAPRSGIKKCPARGRQIQTDVTNLIRSRTNRADKRFHELRIDGRVLIGEGSLWRLSCRLGIRTFRGHCVRLPGRLRLDKQARIGVSNLGGRSRTKQTSSAADCLTGDGSTKTLYAYSNH